MVHDKKYRDAQKFSTPQQILEAKHEADRQLVINLSYIKGKTWQENLARAIALTAIILKLNFGMNISPNISDNSISTL